MKFFISVNLNNLCYKLRCFPIIHWSQKFHSGDKNVLLQYYCNNFIFGNRYYKIKPT